MMICLAWKWPRRTILKSYNYAKDHELGSLRGNDDQGIADDVTSGTSEGPWEYQDQDQDVEAAKPMMKCIVRETCHSMVPAEGYHPLPCTNKGQLTALDPRISDWITETIEHCSSNSSSSSSTTAIPEWITALEACRTVIRGLDDTEKATTVQVSAIAHRSNPTANK